MQEQLARLQAEWDRIFFTLPPSEHAKRFKALSKQAHALREQYPERAEPLVFEGLVLTTHAGAEGGLGALKKLRKARKLLQSSLDIDPKALDGSAYITLGNLYHRLPGWPISYGDDDIARTYFESALKLFPDAIDANYFYGDFLQSQGKFDEALPFLEKAAKAPVRPQSKLSDEKLKAEITEAVDAAHSKKAGRSGFFGGLIPSFGGFR